MAGEKKMGRRPLYMHAPHLVVEPEAKTTEKTGAG